MGFPIIGYEAAGGTLREIYDQLRERPMPAVYRATHGGASGIVQAHSLDPELIAKVFDTATTLDGAGPLAWPERELINAIASRLDQCFYQTACHTEFLRVALDGNEDLPRAVLADPRALIAPRASLGTARMRALAEIAITVTEAPWELSPAHRNRAHAAELSDDDLLHAIVLSAYVGHLNRIAAAVDVPLDVAVQLAPPATDPTIPPRAPAPVAVTGRAAIDLGRRPETSSALAAWRSYTFDRDVPLPRRQRTVIARWVALWLGDGGISAPDDLTFNPLDDALRELAEIVTLAPWRLASTSFARLRDAGFDDAALFDAVAVASSTGVFSRVTVALAALGRARA